MKSLYLYNVSPDITHLAPDVGNVVLNLELLLKKSKSRNLINYVEKNKSLVDHNR